MVAGQLTAFFRLLVRTRKIDGSDRQLLERFVADADEVAFAALVDRHGRLVLGICRSVLRHEQDAEDAFQATFLVLARLASSIRKRDSLASWLHGVALRTALKARRAMANRRRNERQASVPSQQEPDSEAALRELQTIIHEEIARLPDKYRAPFVLCSLEGKSRAEAAQQLGWKEGTVSGRIAQARSLLEGRLVRRGVALPAALAAAALWPAPATAAIPVVVRAALDFAADRVSQTLSPFVAPLAQGVIQAMYFTKLKTIAAVALVLAAVFAGGGWLAYAALQPEQRNPGSGTSPPGLAARVSPPATGHLPLASQDGPTTANVKRVNLQGDALPPGAICRLGTVRFHQPGSLHHMAFSPDSKSVVFVINQDDEYVLRFMDIATWKELGQFKVKKHERNPDDERNPPLLAFSPDGKTVGVLDQFVELFDAKTGQHLQTFGRGLEIYSFAFSPDNKLLAAGCMEMKKDNPIRVWEIATGRELSFTAL